MTVLVTGGAGYIGSHTCVELLNQGKKVVVVDNLSNSSEKSLDRVREITGKELDFYQVDLLDKENLTEIFKKHEIESVIHFAGLKAVGESVEKPGLYYHNNVTGSIVLFEVMAEFGVKNIVFSSSATVYGDPASLPITEEFPLSQTNPYGTAKYFIEIILKDLQTADEDLNVAILRYFNPVGAHKSGKIGEDPIGTPNNLMPFISQVAVKKRPEVMVFGDDYDTPDGTGVRDYIHVVDLAKGHIKTLDHLESNPGFVVYNLGKGKGYSVLELIKAFEKASGVEIPYKVVGRRDGDIASSWADPAKAESELGWTAEMGLEEMCEDTWRWQSENPKGFN
ncbi:MAG: UDP-glucose 4-epimerase GalE [Chloroflexi bacterium]|jgi:UDP-glucose 4-epimerase|nr:UDP-glucose 4-epimerase GalE [Chloroflexota bacterium]MBT3669813.1 UDP-glucose 4-epimerase GalE [Chloroflexota bacterium]MBT4002407.1 UDP-glucose 4-epimerase GalE [Chloroflexota bacterium]MBT4304714.1 UDP-glucose 4-epimerase GalE [Chloroflexota bacterium]MBT4534784.1 UDP-glucose 4-epimerase GalE [Chloroflexota bacterium]